MPVVVVAVSNSGDFQDSPILLIKSGGYKFQWKLLLLQLQIDGAEGALPILLSILY